MSVYRALVIEDDIDLATIFSKAIEAGGYDVETITNGKAALERLEGEAPAIVVLDMHLPGVDGISLHHKIKSEPRFKKTRVIIATADAVLAETMQDGFDLILLKPISYVQLRDLAKRLLPHEE